MTSPALSISPQDAIRELWRIGDLSYQVRDYQDIIYNNIWGAITNPEVAKYALLIARRFGKSHILCLVAIEYAIRNPNTLIRFAAPTAKSLKKITLPLFRKILKDCPEEFRPQYKQQDQTWFFPSGSEIHCSGTDNGAHENLRGQESHLNLVDEAGFCDQLDYTIRSILQPQTLTNNGTTILSSTPPKTPAHDFRDIFLECAEEGNSLILTIDDNKSLTERTINLYAKEAGGKTSSTYRREYLCEWVVDEDLAITPEFNEYIHVKEIDRDKFYPFYQKYEAMDIGWSAYTAILFGFYNFKEAKLYIEDEIVIKGKDVTTLELANLIQNKEKILWKEQKAYRKIADNNDPEFLAALAKHKVYFNPVHKNSLEAMVNKVRLWLGQERIIIHPKCKMTIGCLHYGIWNEHRTKWEENKTYGHFDALASLQYLLTAIDEHTNPVPKISELEGPVHNYHIKDKKALLKNQSASQKNLEEFYRNKKKRFTRPTN